MLRPEYSKWTYPWIDGPLRKIEKIGDRDFRIAMSEAYLAFSAAIDQETAARMRRQRRRGVAQPCSRAEIKATALVERRRGDIVLLLGGLLGMYLPADNEAVLAKAQQMCIEARERDRLLPIKKHGVADDS